VKSFARRLRLLVLLAFVVGLFGSEAGAQPLTIPARPAVVAGNVWLLRNSLTSGFADSSFVYGTSKRAGVPVTGDWDGDGLKTPGVIYDNKWFLRNSNTTGFADIAFTYGVKGDFPIVGDWDGDGIDSPGVTREDITFLPPDGVIIHPNTWHLRNSNTTGVADVDVAFASPGSPVVGDWDGDGDDGIGMVFRNTNRWVLDNDLNGTVDAEFFYGTAKDFPVAGDWDGDGDDTPGVRPWNVWAVRNSNTTGPANLSFGYGSGTHWPLVWGEAI
jgi:hypothetical protein